MTLRSRPLGDRWHGGENRLDVAAGLQPEHGAAVVEQIEFHVAPAADELLLALGLVPADRVVAPHQLGIDPEKGLADRFREREVGLPVAAVEPVIENAADAAHFPAVLER